jgi:2'-hydroxyisoflavone reductase
MIEVSVEVKEDSAGSQVSEFGPRDDTRQGCIPAGARHLRRFRKPERRALETLEPRLTIKDRGILSARFAVGTAHAQPRIFRKKFLEIIDLSLESFLHTHEIGVMKADHAGHELFSIRPRIGTITRLVVTDVESHDSDVIYIRCVVGTYANERDNESRNESHFEDSNTSSLPATSSGMKLLILGGTRFLGRHLVEAALERGHEVTLFNRGTYSVFDVETIKGDRNEDLSKLRGRSWDAVTDTCGYLPGAVRVAAEVLSDAVDRYIFISSQSVYADVSVRGVDETHPLKTLTDEELDLANSIDPEGAAGYGALYGGLKALCEQAAEAVMPGRVLNVRPGLIVGPNDYTDRFTYWVMRVARGGEVLAPGRPQRPVQLIDVRDLAEWTVLMAEQKQQGVFNVNRQPRTLTMEGLLDECKSTSGSDATFTWVSEQFLRDEEVMAWSAMPVYLPEQDAPQLAGFMYINCDRAFDAGLQIRPLSATISGTLAWAQAELNDSPLKAGIDAEKERTLLRKWRETQSHKVLWLER